jgi:NAD binding domain of 6-phosphogluconate dehydrogenase
MSVTKLSQLNVRIGFIGLGLMGSRLVRRLDSFGWRIRAWNRSQKPADEINKWGIAIAPSIADLVTNSDVIISSLANDAAVRSVYLDKGSRMLSQAPETESEGPVSITAPRFFEVLAAISSFLPPRVLLARHRFNRWPRGAPINPGDPCRRNPL